MTYEQILEFIIQKRQEQGYSMRKLSSMAGLSPPALCRIEDKSSKASYETLMQLCSSLGYDLEVIPEQYNIKPKK